MHVGWFLLLKPARFGLANSALGGGSNVSGPGIKILWFAQGVALAACNLPHPGGLLGGGNVA